MILWGWGGRSLQRQVSDTQTVVLSHRYFHLMFLLTAAYNYKFLLATLTEHGWATAEISGPDASRLLNGQVLQPGLWARFSLLAAVGVAALLIIGSSLPQG
jgi:hypothetical protein